MTTITASPTTQSAGATWVQTGTLNFQEALTTTDQHITDVPTLRIPFPGVWELTYHVRASFKPKEKRALWVHTFLGRNGQTIEGTEATIGIHGPDAEAVQAVGGQTFMTICQAGEEVTLHARFSGEGKASIISNGDGRTGVVARWVSPGF